MNAENFNFTVNFLGLFFLVFYGFVGWKVYTKAGKPGWAALIPIYNIIVYLEIIGRPIWWIVLLFIPIVNFIVAIITLFYLAKVFGKGIGFALGLLFLNPIFYAILAFGDAEYQGVSS